MKKLSLRNLLITCCLILTMLGTACAGGGGGEQGKNADTKTSGASTESTDLADMPTLIWLMGDPGTVPSDQERVEAALNKISMEKLGVKMKTLFYNDDNVKLALASGEKWDIAFTCEWYNNYAVQAHAGYFADITDKVKALTPKLYDTMPEVVWDGARVYGNIYAVPTKKDYAAEVFYRFDKKLFLDDLKMDVPPQMDFLDVEPYLKAAKEAYQSGLESASEAETPLKLVKAGFPGVDSNFDMINRDVMLGIPYSAVGTSKENTVVLTVECPDMTERLAAVRRWYEAGYINADASTSDDVGRYSAVKYGQGFYGADAIWSGADAYAQVISKFNGPYLSTVSIRGSMNAINAKSPHIDLALQYLQLVNTDKEYRDILRYGIEGEHWNRESNGLVKRTVAGQQGYQPWPFSQGSYSLASVESAEGIEVDPDMWNVIFDGYQEAVATQTIGFSFDIANVEAQVAACTAIKNKYFNSLACGALNLDEALPAFIAELESAGIRAVQAECQKQLDAFIAGD